MQKPVARLITLVAIFVSVLAVSTAETSQTAEAAAAYKMPWQAGAWNVTQGLHQGAWDFQPPGAGSHNNEVLAVAAGTAKVICTDSIGQATVQLTVGSDVFKYLHLKTSDVTAAGITTGGVAVQQGQVLGRLYPTINWNGICGTGSGSHLHLVMPYVPITIDGVTFSNTGPNGVTSITSTNQRNTGTVDSDGDGVPDPQDRCPAVRAGITPDPNRPGCSLAKIDVHNASFEQGSFANWDQFPGGFIDHESRPDPSAKEGDSIGVAITSVAGRSFAQDIGPAPVAGVNYNFSMWVRSPTGQPFTGTIKLYAVEGPGVEGDGTEFTVGSDWTLVSAPLGVFQAGHDHFRLQIYLTTVGIPLYVDGATLASGNQGTVPKARAVPLAPSGATATAGNAQATVAWNAPSSNGGSAITGYVVTPYVGATAQAARTYNSTATSQKITGLTNGVTYTFKVAAKNAIGTGSQSAASNPVRPSGSWYLRNSNSAGPSIGGFRFGSPGDIPVAGDWDGNSTTTVGIYRPSMSTWYLRNTNTAGTPSGGFVYGSPGDKPVVGNWDGTGGDTIGVYRPTNSFWFLRNANSAGSSIGGFGFGNTADEPVTGNWDGSGGDSISVFR